MIDLHCHILPGVDDGAATLDDAVAMARVAASDGILAAVATPHGAEWAYCGSAEETKNRVQDVQAALAQANVALDLLPGLEAHLRPEMGAACTRGEIYTLNSSRYLLVEFPLQALPVYADQALFNLQLRGIVPIIAHPERNQAIVAGPELLWRMVEKGMLTQITAGSLVGEFGAKTREVAELLVRHRMAHIIASDSHSAMWRAPRLSAAVERASDLIGPRDAEAMVVDIPRAIVNDEIVDVPPPLPLEKRRSWFPFGRRK